MYARCINISMATPWFKKEAFLYRVNVTILLLFTWNYCPGVLHNVCFLYEVWAACLTLHPSAEFHENLNSISFVILQTIKPNHSPWWSAWQHNSGRRKEGFYVKSVEERSSIQPFTCDDVYPKHLLTMPQQTKAVRNLKASPNFPQVKNQQATLDSFPPSAKMLIFTSRAQIVLNLTHTLVIRSG